MNLRELILDESVKKSNNNKKILDYLDSTKDFAEIKNILEMKVKDVYSKI